MVTLDTNSLKSVAITPAKQTADRRQVFEAAFMTVFIVATFVFAVEIAPALAG
jgi:hypothetical protein